MTAKKKPHKHKDAEVSASSATLRDDFAKAAIFALCHSTMADEGQALDIATRAYLLADAMLIAREQQPDNGDEDQHPPPEEFKG